MVLKAISTQFLIKYPAISQRKILLKESNFFLYSKYDGDGTHISQTQKGPGDSRASVIFGGRGK